MKKENLKRAEELIKERVDILNNMCDNEQEYRVNKTYYNGMMAMLNALGYDYVVFDDDARIVEG